MGLPYRFAELIALIIMISGNGYLRFLPLLFENLKSFGNCIKDEDFFDEYA